MTRDDIIRMARVAGCHDNGEEFRFVELHYLERFAALVAAAERERVMQIVQSMKANLEAKFENVYMEGAMAGAAAEREACAKVCEEFYSIEGIAQDCAAAIRARSNK